MKISFFKTYQNPRRLVSLLESRGVSFSDKLNAEKSLLNIGYYRLSAYMHPFLLEPKTDHFYKPDTNFDKILDLYRFDENLRVLLFSQLEGIEVAFREAIANVTAEMTGDIFWMTNREHYKNAGAFEKTLSIITSEYNKSSEDFIEHFKEKYLDPFPPAWILSEILPFGSLSRTYRNLADLRIKKRIAKMFYLQPRVFESWLNVMIVTRNACCHHSRIWNKVNPITPTMPLAMTRPWVSLIPIPDKVYCNICIIRYFVNVISPGNKFRDNLVELLKEYPQIDIKAMGFPEDWLQEPLWQA